MEASPNPCTEASGATRRYGIDLDVDASPRPRHRRSTGNDGGSPTAQGYLIFALMAGRTLTAAYQF